MQDVADHGVCAYMSWVREREEQFFKRIQPLLLCDFASDQVTPKPIQSDTLSPEARSTAVAFGLDVAIGDRAAPLFTMYYIPDGFPDELLSLRKIGITATVPHEPGKYYVLPPKDWKVVKTDHGISFFDPDGGERAMVRHNFPGMDDHVAVYKKQASFL